MRMSWLLVLLAWTVCAVVAAPVVGRALAHSGVVEHQARRPVHRRRSLPTPRERLVLR
jgi:hypothetical protein